MARAPLIVAIFRAAAARNADLHERVQLAMRRESREEFASARVVGAEGEHAAAIVERLRRATHRMVQRVPRGDRLSRRQCLHPRLHFGREELSLVDPVVEPFLQLWRSTPAP